MSGPGVAKSQLLNHMIIVAPGGAYTASKGSSGVGLSVSV